MSDFDTESPAFTELLANAAAAAQEESAIPQLISIRESTHGDYTDTARCAQRLKDLIRIESFKRSQRGQPELKPTQKESLDLICTKIARIISGNADELDHWDDIEGYARLGKKEIL